MNEKVVPGGSPALGAGLKRQGIAAAPRYIQKPAFQCEVFKIKGPFGSSRFPFTLADPEAVDYSPARFPGVFAACATFWYCPGTSASRSSTSTSSRAAVRTQHAHPRGNR